MRADYHIHTPYCGHARGTTLDYVEAALAAGLDEICFTDHLYRYYLSRSQRRRYWEWGMNSKKLFRYYTEIRDLADHYKDRITIRVGLEVDYVEGAEELLTPILGIYSLDFLVGSIHCLPKFGWHHLVQLESVSPADLYRDYFATALSAVESGLIHSLAPLDFIWRFIEWPVEISSELYRRIDEVVLAAKNAGCCMEINMNGYMWATLNETGRCAPFSRMIDAIAACNAPVTIGSDAHNPDQVGRSFDQALTFLASRNINTCAVFRQGERRMSTLG